MGGRTVNKHWEEISFLLSSKNRKKVIFSLDKPKIPTELASSLGLNLSHVSRALTELSEKKLVECLTPKQKMGKLYSKTKLGNTVVSYLRKRS